MNENSRNQGFIDFVENIKVSVVIVIMLDELSVFVINFKRFYPIVFLSVFV